MKIQKLIPAKATLPEEQSDAIVVSFGPESKEHLRGKLFSVVIRKRIPTKSASYKWLYFHIKNPIGAVFARAKIRRIFTATKDEALARAKEMNMMPAEIAAYIGNDETIGCYELEAFQLASKPITKAALATRMIYHPPQSFFILSRSAKTIVDEMAGFSVATSTPLTKVVQ
ncbi:MAG: hypothetical protein WCO04_18965 [Pseudomonadota bacterium]|jgi:predicted transcriptional regulator